ncbi:ISAs1 family transposase [Mesorhizobium sp.]|uniref:ISAs1 family transposase n=1 Tax=Mesorhizobium sp. TaxID=1871066 RepID=UPI00338D77B1
MPRQLRRFQQSLWPHRGTHRHRQSRGRLARRPAPFPGELRLPDATTILRVSSRTGLKDKSRFDTRYFVASAELTAERAAHAVRGHWLVENALHWTLDVVFNDDQSLLRKGHGALEMAIVRHFALNLVRAVSDRHSIKLRRKKAGWSTDYLAAILGDLRR